MGKLYKFIINNKRVKPFQKKERKALTKEGCNEPFKNRFWCPKKRWFMIESCPFINRRECESFERMTREDWGKIVTLIKKEDQK